MYKFTLIDEKNKKNIPASLTVQLYFRVFTVFEMNTEPSNREFCVWLHVDVGD